jgi:hypothetical protein
MSQAEFFHSHSHPDESRDPGVTDAAKDYSWNAWYWFPTFVGMTGFGNKVVPHLTTVLAGFIPAIHGGASVALEPPALRGSQRLAPQGEGYPASP